VGEEAQRLGVERRRQDLARPHVAETDDPCHQQPCEAAQLQTVRRGSTRTRRSSGHRRRGTALIISLLVLELVHRRRCRLHPFLFRRPLLLAISTAFARHTLTQEAEALGYMQGLLFSKLVISL
jgi:hypothetical protein